MYFVRNLSVKWVNYLLMYRLIVPPYHFSFQASFNSYGNLSVTWPTQNMIESWHLYVLPSPHVCHSFFWQFLAKVRPFKISWKIEIDFVTYSKVKFTHINTNQFWTLPITKLSQVPFKFPTTWKRWLKLESSLKKKFVSISAYYVPEISVY